MCYTVTREALVNLRCGLERLRREHEATRAWCQGQEDRCTAPYATCAAIEQVLEALAECGDGGEEVDLGGRGQDGPMTLKLCTSLTRAECLLEPLCNISSTSVAYADFIPPSGVNDA